MKKLLTLIVVAVMSCLLLVGCGENKWQSSISVDTYSGKTESSNGGFLVEKGDYIYFINGVESNTAENTLGKPIRGAIVRLKKSEIGSLNANPEIVVPKVVFSSDFSSGSGIFIFGDYIYYATPCAIKNSNGAIRNTEIEFSRMKLNGEDVSVITTEQSISSKYRFVKIGDSVHLVLTSTDDEGKTILKTINCDTKAVTNSKVYTEYMFASDVNCKYAFYTAAVHNDEKDLDESYNAIYRFALDGSDGSGKMVFSGMGRNNEKNWDFVTESAAGVTFDLIAFNGKQLFIKEDLVIPATTSWYYGVENVENLVTCSDEDLADETKMKALFDGNYNNSDNFVLLDQGRSISSTVFAETSIYVNLHTILYIDSAKGVVKFDYKPSLTSDADSQGRIIICPKEIEIAKVSHSVKFVDFENGYIYTTDSSNNYYRTDLGVAINLKTGEKLTGTPKVTRITYAMTPNSSWFLPEVVTVGEKEFLLASVTGSLYGTYIFATDMNATKGMDEIALADYEESVLAETRNNVDERMKFLVGIRNQADHDAFISYRDTNYPTK